MKTRLYLKIPIVCAILVVGAATLNAQATRTWVSGVGDDVNPCSRTAPCKTFAGAISKTAASGEISVLDPGGFGAVTIGKGITLNGTGTLAGILSANTNGVIVNALTSDTIIIRDISINGAGTGINGIRFLAGKTLVVDHCRIYGMTTRGIDAALSSSGNLKMFDTDIVNVNTAVGASTTSGSVSIDASNITVEGTSNGFTYVSNATGTITRSFFTTITPGNAISAASGCTVNVTQCHFRSNAGAMNASAGSTIRISENEMFQNTNALAGTASSFQSANNNKQAGNGATITPTGTAIAVQ